MSETTPAGAARGGTITAETVQHLATLSRIALSDTERDTLTRELTSILAHIAKVSEVVGPDIEATSHPIPLNNVTREDRVADVLTLEEALMNAPETSQGMFRVSSILGEEQE